MHLKPFIRLLMLIACLAGAAQSPSQAFGAEPVKIGVIAFPTKAQAVAQWQPLTVVLKEAMPERDFVVVALNHTELAQAVAARQLDFVLTNGGQYVLLRNRNGLSSPLATLASNGTGRSLTVYAGVIFTRAGQADINTLSDIKGKTVAAVTTASQGAYQMQAYELSRVGIHLPQDVKLITNGFSPDQVVAAVLAGDAEVGFVRSGVLEGMVRKGRLDIKELKILNRQDLPEFPFQVSTRLYPEWSFAAMPHIDENIARHVAAVLFILDENKAATRAMGIHGFVVPADYSPVEEVLRELRMPPFDVVPRFTLHDVWARYRWQTMGAFLAGGVIFLLGMIVLLMYRRLVASHHIVLLHQHKLQESEEKFRALVESTSDWIWEVDRNGRYTYVSPRVEALLGYKPEEVLGKSPFDLMVPEEAQRVGKIFAEIIGKRLPLVSLENTGLHKDGRLVVLETSAVPFFDPQGEFAGYRGIDRDITERKQAAQDVERLRHEMALILEAAGEGICTFDVNGYHVLVNPSAARMFGYEAEEMIGRHSHSLWHYAKADGTSYPEEECPIYVSMRDSVTYHTESELFWRKDGTSFPVEYVSAPIQSNGTLTGGVIVFHDITERKRAEDKSQRYSAELEKKNHELREALANVKQLTGMLPICAYCKNIRDDKGYWSQVESYISDHTQAVFSHGMCPDCEKKQYDELARLKKENS